MTKKLLNTLFALWPLLLAAQDPHVSSIHSFRTYINPAYTGFNNNLEFNLGRRDQWARVPRKLSTNIVSGNFYCDNKRMGFGFIGMNNKEGEGLVKTNSFSGIFAGIKRGIIKRPRYLQNYEIGAALQVGAIQKFLDWDELVFSDQLHPVYGNIYQTAAQPQPNASPIMPDIGGGVLFRTGAMGTKYSKKSFLKGSKEGNYFTLGAAFQHLNRPLESFLGDNARLPIRWNIHTNYNFQNTTPRATNVYSINFIYQKQADLERYMLGLGATLSGFTSLHLWYRSSIMGGKPIDEYIMSAYTFFKIPGTDNEMAIGLSLEIPELFRMNKHPMGPTAEVCVKFDLNAIQCPEPKKNTRKLDNRRKCPRLNSENEIMMKANRTGKQQDKFMKRQKRKINFYEKML